jgi:hypothetical protein
MALLLSLTPLIHIGDKAGAVAPSEQGQASTYRGKVVPLADLAAKAGTRLDSDAGPHSLVLAGEDGKVWLLLKDGGSRMFFKDSALLNRPMQLTGRPLPGSQVLRVMAVHSLLKGQLHDVYYWCDICAIKRSEKSICECCGGPMDLKEEPVKK